MLKTIKKYSRLVSLNFLRTVLFCFWVNRKSNRWYKTLCCKRDIRTRFDSDDFIFVRQPTRESFSMQTKKSFSSLELSLFLMMKNLLTIKAYEGESYVYFCSWKEFIRIYLNRYEESDIVSGVIQDLYEQKQVKVNIRPCFFLPVNKIIGIANKRNR